MFHMSVETQTSQSHSVIAQQVAEFYTLVYPEQHVRSKVMRWLDQARKCLVQISLSQTIYATHHTRCRFPRARAIKIAGTAFSIAM
jgi:hypothetical protein